MALHYATPETPLGGVAMRQSRANVEHALDTMRLVAQLCVFNNVKVLSKSIERIYDAAFRPAGLRASQVALLWTILSTEPTSVKAIAKAANADETTVSRIVARAHRAGLLSIGRDPQDRRQKVVALSAAGRAKLAQVLPLWTEAQRSVETFVDPDAFRRLARRAAKSRAGIVPHARAGL